jgi:hypothetical protein
MEDNLNLLKMEDDLKFMKMEDDFFFENGRQPQKKWGGGGYLKDYIQ